jgi:hypothetical protein
MSKEKEDFYPIGQQGLTIQSFFLFEFSALRKIQIIFARKIPDSQTPKPFRGR